MIPISFEETREIVRRAEEREKQKQKEFAVSELEKLKVKVIALSYDCKIATIDRYEVEKLIDRQIAELKGESNEQKTET